MIDALSTVYPLGDGIGCVELIGILGNDLTVVNAARVSFNKRSEELNDRDKRLIRRMMRLQHGSPFEHVVLQFRVKAPLHVVHQWERHRMASYNEESGRWSLLQPEFFTPDDDFAEENERHWDLCYALYRSQMDRGQPMEKARLVLPISLYKTFYFTCNVRSLLNFIGLRNHPEAQEQIRLYAGAIEDMMMVHVPTVIDSFNDHERRQP